MDVTYFTGLGECYVIASDQSKRCGTPRAGPLSVPHSEATEPFSGGTSRALAFPASSAPSAPSALRCCQLAARQTSPPPPHPPLRDPSACNAQWGRAETAGASSGREMVLLTMIARLADGLPLAASMQEDEQVKQAGVISPQAERVSGRAKTPS